MTKKILFILALYFVIINLPAVNIKDEVKQIQPARIEAKNNFYIFIDAAPVNNYTVIGTIETAAIIKNYKASYLIDHLKTRALKKFANANALIIASANNLTSAQVIIIQ